MVFKMLKEPQVLDATGWSHSTLWQKIKDGKFRAPIKIDPDGRAVGWPEPWIEEIQREAIERQQASVADSEAQASRTRAA
jgi:predicted DNA-binding transcriptional regulator AlpA